MKKMRAMVLRANGAPLVMEERARRAHPEPPAQKGRQ